jgi:hypothetical protein
MLYIDFVVQLHHHLSYLSIRNYNCNSPFEAAFSCRNDRYLLNRKAKRSSATAEIQAINRAISRNSLSPFIGISPLFTMTTSTNGVSSIIKPRVSDVTWICRCLFNLLNHFPALDDFTKHLQLVVGKTNADTVWPPSSQGAGSVRVMKTNWLCYYKMLSRSIKYLCIRSIICQGLASLSRVVPWQASQLQYD